MNPSTQRILVCSAWPYGSGLPHLGNLIGCLLSGDAFTRFYRLRGFETLHVSGTDAHGTKVEFEAAQAGVSPRDLADRVHRKITEILARFEVAIDNYTTTESPVHHEFVTQIYREMETEGYIVSREEARAFCQGCNRFLADRFIIGACPRCGYLHAQGNQCDACGALLEPESLRSPHCAFCGSSDIKPRTTRHWYLDLEKLTPKLLDYVGSRDFRGNVKLFTERLIQDGLRPRAVTRDIRWGIPAPFPGAEGKVIYVWAEAALGYVSATIEHFRRLGHEERWREFWFGDQVWQIYTQAKDNIPFHTIIFPAQLLAAGRGYHLPDQIAATEYLNWIGGEQFSKTRRVGIFADEALELLPPVYWRFYLFYNRPESKDVEFSWEEFDKAVNHVLVDNIANFVHRVLSYVWTRHNATVPDRATDPEVIEAIEATLTEVVRTVEAGALAPALRAIALLAGTGNEYMQRTAPWRTGDARAVASAAHLVKALAILLEPFVPMFSQDVYAILGIANPRFADARCGLSGHALAREPRPLLAHVDVAELKRRYQEMKEEGLVSFEEFQKLDLRVGRILVAEEIPGADKLLRLQIDLGDRQAQAVAGIRQHYRPADLTGKLVAVMANLKPATIRGIRSECMVLAAADGTLALLTPEREVEPGARIR
ncbi:MAG: Methionyl-tRNA synthetase [Candidatus Bipolaricaulis sibiricus]|uniref:Methionine--tRNA ligase n=1 Tax=Bipolaricaulis sibiricus TaxID=2501609 RepID=A0A410FTZ6_BIPS1|nr:MAG: Methionyl-tRNA synthetase [Candidatus Bipolaricaulis sibiricus]